jgi:methionyl-tRNA formyltransferase
MQLQASPVKQCAIKHGTPVAQPVSLRLNGKYPDVAQEAHALLQSTPHDVMVVAAYGLILPRSVLDIPRLGCINIHGSLLPRWRGAAPIHRAIEAGDAETGITIMQMEEGLDTGPMMLIESLPIAEDDTTGSLHDKLAALGGKMIVEAIARLEQGALPATPQPEEGANYAARSPRKRPRWTSARARDSWPAASAPSIPSPARPAALAIPWSSCGRRVRSVAQPGEPGQVLSADAQAGIVVACGEGALLLTELQKPGGKRLPAAEFLKGFPLEGGRFA